MHTQAKDFSSPMHASPILALLHLLAYNGRCNQRDRRL
jgi:hypothetical protein